MVMDFLNMPDREMILFTLNPTGVLMPMLDFPDGLKTKVSYFIKLGSAEVTKSNYESILVYGEVSTNPLKDLKAVTEHVSNNTVIICNTYE